MIVPAVDLIFSEDGINPPNWAYRQLSNDKFYRWCTFLFIPLLFAAFAIACYLWADPALSLRTRSAWP